MVRQSTPDLQGSAGAPLAVAVRALALPPTTTLRRKLRPHPTKGEGWPRHVLLFDTETTIDPSQRLLYGMYRLGEWMPDRGGGLRLAILEEGVFSADDLPDRDPTAYAIIREFAANTTADVEPGEPQEFQVMSRAEFAEKLLFGVGYQGRTPIVGFNLPFDLSRVAVGASATRPRRGRRKMAGGWSLELVRRPDGSPHPFRPRIAIRHIDSKRSLMEFTGCQDPARLPPENGRKTGPVFRGAFIDLRTLAFALTDRSLTLDGACELLGARVRKTPFDRHGEVSPESLDYCRNDVRATAALLEVARAEFDRHPIDILPWAVLSPASIAKGYFRAMGITPPLTRLHRITRHQLGAAMASYFGGRTEVRIRKTVVPVVSLDATSMYPTVNILAQMQEYLIAERLQSESCTREAREMLGRVSVEACLDRTLWPKLRFFAQIAPHGDIVPIRAEYAGRAHGPTIGLNPLSSTEGHWYTGFDLAAAILLGKRVPKVLRAFRIVPHGTASTLREVKLRGEVPLDPRSHDVFQQMVEERQRVKRDTNRPQAQRDALDRGIKVVANSGSYGIAAEATPRTLPRGERESVHVEWGGAAFETETSAPEEPGEYFFPPTAALITGAARLLLALLQRHVEDAGGTYLAMDTDSIFVVATARGGLVPCSGGPHRTRTGQPAVRALSWGAVDAIVARLDRLKPYGSDVPGPLFKIEDENCAPGTTTRRQLFGLALAAKRYCLFNRDRDGGICIRKASEHGLGVFLDPTDPEGKVSPIAVPEPNSGWIAEVWRRFVRRVEGHSPGPPPRWWRRPALRRLAATSPGLLAPFAASQEQLTYPERLKPFGFLLTPSVRPGGHPAGMDPGACRLVAPYERDPAQWLVASWVDLYSGKGCRVTTAPVAGPETASLQTIGDVVEDYWAHGEAKCLGPDGAICGAGTRGLLRARPVVATRLVAIGKEANRLSDVEDGTVATWNEVQQVYHRPAGGTWEADVLPRLTALATEVAVRQLAQLTGVSQRTLWRLKAGENPGKATRKKLLRWVDALRTTPGAARAVTPRQAPRCRRTRSRNRRS